MRSQLVANGTLAFRTAVFRRPQQSCRTLLLLLLLLDEKWLERALLACGLAISFSCLCLCRRRQGDNKSYIVCLPEAAKWEGGKKGGALFKQLTDCCFGGCGEEASSKLHYGRGRRAVGEGNVLQQMG